MRLVTQEWAHTTRRVAAIRPLDLDYLGAVVRQELGAVGPGDVMRQVNDQHAIQSSRHIHAPP